MARTDHSTSPFHYVSDQHDDETIICLKEKIGAENAAAIFKNLRALLKSISPSILTVDLREISYMDDFGAQILLELKGMMAAKASKFRIINIPAHAREIISQVILNPEEPCVLYQRRKKLNIFARLGEATLHTADNIRFMVSFLGSVIIAFLYICIHPKSLRIDDTLSNMEKTGVDAVPIVALISFLLGLIIAFMSALQLRQFGANIYVASLVAFSMVSELGPIMTAIVVAGRSGSAFAAEIGTMKISEEVDALFVMGFNPALFLAVPKIFAALIVVPLLTLFSDLFGIFGGFIIGVAMLDLSLGAYMKQTLEALTMFEVMWGLMKSAVFAVIIAWIGCLRGFQARGGPAGVGNAATSAVVTSIFLIIFFDSIFAILRSYWK